MFSPQVSEFYFQPGVHFLSWRDPAELRALDQSIKLLENGTYADIRHQKMVSAAKQVCRKHFVSSSFMSSYSGLAFGGHAAVPFDQMYSKTCLLDTHTDGSATREHGIDATCDPSTHQWGCEKPNSSHPAGCPP